MRAAPPSVSKTGLAWLLTLVTLLLMGGPAFADRGQSQRLLQKAVQMMDKGPKGFADADLLLQRAIAADPKWDKPHAVRAAFQQGFPNYDLAANEWRAAIKLNPKNPGYRVQLGKTLMAAKKWDEASEAWIGYQKVKPKDAAAPYNLALIALEKGVLDKAEKFVGEAQKLEPTNQKFALLQARIDVRQGELEPAAATLRKVVEGTPAQHEVHLEAEALLADVEGQLFQQKVKLGLIVGVPLLVIVGALVLMKLMRRVEIKAPPTRLDPSSAESICKYALDHVAAITGLPRGIAWAVALDGQKMELRASELIGELGPLTRRNIDAEALGKWLEANGGSPFLYKAEVKEPNFLQAFPELSTDLGGVEMNVGVPLMWRDSFRGLLLLGRSRSAGKMDLRNRFDKHVDKIQEIGEQAAQALDQLLKEQGEVTDLQTGVWNKEFYERYTAEALQGCRTAGLPMAVFMVRMDAFDEILERYGEGLSGEILASLVQVLQDCIRQEENTTLCRVEGGVFAIVAPERGLRESPSLAQRLKAAIDGMKISRNLPKPTGCVAYGIFPDHADDAGSLRRTTARAFRDAVYLEGNRILEAERGGAMEREEEVDPNRKTVIPGRKSLTSPSPATAVPAEAVTPKPGEPGTKPPFMPFSPPSPQAADLDDSGWLSPGDADEDATPPVRTSRFGASDRAPETRRIDVARAGLRGGGAPEVPEVEPPRPAPPPNRVGRLGMGPGPGEKAPETQKIPIPRPLLAPPETEAEDEAEDEAVVEAPPRAFGSRPAPPPSTEAEQEVPAPPQVPPRPTSVVPVVKPPAAAAPPPARPAPAPAKAEAPAPRPAPGVPPAAPRPASAEAPAAPRPAPGVPPAAPRPASAEAPAAPRPAPGVPPAAPRPASAEAPAAPLRPPAGAAPAVPAPAASRPMAPPSPTRPAAAPPPTAARPAAPPAKAATPPAGSPARPAPATPAAKAAPASPAVKATTPVPPAARPAAPAAPGAKPTAPAAPAAKPVAASASPASKPMAPPTPVRPAAAAPTPPPARPAPAPAPVVRPAAAAAPGPSAGLPPAPAAPEPAEGQSLDDLGIDLDTQFCFQETFEDLSAYEVRMAAEEGLACSIVYLRLDNLAELKSAGAEAYRQMRRDLTSLVHTFLREGVDVPGLFGPDEYALLLTGTSLATASNLANQIAMTVGNLDAGGVGVRPAVGVASFPELAGEGPQLIDAARKATQAGPGVHVHRA